MKIKKEIYYGLIMVFILLICVLFVSLHKYNEERKELVTELQSKGYVCNKDPFGFYKSCTRPNELLKLGIDIPFNNSGDLK